MKIHSSYILTSTLAVASILLVGGSHRWHQTTTGIATRDTEAAFRDGVFQAKLDVQNGRKPRIASGRWSTNRDRGLFIAGYQQSYRDSSQSQSRTFTEPSAAELAGYRDGMHDGSEHRRTSQVFQFNKTDRYRTAGHGYLEINSDPNTYKQDYRLAYSNGYQQGYYSQQEPEQVEVKTASDTTGR
jgi:hypothetical protein